MSSLVFILLLVYSKAGKKQAPLTRNYIFNLKKFNLFSFNFMTLKMVTPN